MIIPLLPGEAQITLPVKTSDTVFGMDETVAVLLCAEKHPVEVLVPIA